MTPSSAVPVSMREVTGTNSISQGPGGCDAFLLRGSRPLHPFEGETIPIDPEAGRGLGKYSWAKSPRYDIGGGLGNIPLEAGPPWPVGWPRAVRMRCRTRTTTRCSPPTCTTRSARACSSARWRACMKPPQVLQVARQWLDDIDLKESFYTKPTEYAEGKGFGATEAARGSAGGLDRHRGLQDQELSGGDSDGVEYRPRDGAEVLGPIEQALVGSPIVDVEDPVELGHVARSFDSCLVCTVHAYDGKTGKEMSKFVINGMV